MSILWILLILVLARWALSAYSAGGHSELEARHTAEIARLREEVDQLGAQVLRLQDEQSFMMRLLTDGKASAEDPALPPAEAAPEDQNPENP